MRKAALAAIASVLLAGSPAIAAQSNAGSAQHAQSVQSGSAQKLVNDAANEVRQLQGDQRLNQLMKQAKGVFIVPHFVKGAAIVGGETGQGILLAHKENGWSNPAFFTLASGSIGPQVGGEAGPVVLILMTDKALHDFTGNGNFSLNANAGLTIVDYSTLAQGNVGKGDVILWSGTTGGFVGANISGTNITPNLNEDRDYYGKQTNTQQIIEGAVRNAGADALRNALPA